MIYLEGNIMEIKRCVFIVDFKGKEVFKRLSKMDVNLIYIFKKFNYVIVYFDEVKGEKFLVNYLKNVKGFMGVIFLLFYDENVNI